MRRNKISILTASVLLLLLMAGIRWLLPLSMREDRVETLRASETAKTSSVSESPVAESVVAERHDSVGAQEIFRMRIVHRPPQISGSSGPVPAHGPAENNPSPLIRRTPPAWFSDVPDTSALRPDAFLLREESLAGIDHADLSELPVRGQFVDALYRTYQKEKGNIHAKRRYVRGLELIEELAGLFTLARADVEGIEVKGIDEKGRSFLLIGFENGEPVYSLTTNLSAAESTGANLVRQSFDFDGTHGPGLDGSGFFFNVNDHGIARQHLEFQRPNNGGSRLIEREVPDNDGHMDHVTGTVGAHGYRSDAKGMAPAAVMYSLNQQSDSDVYLLGMEYPMQPQRSIGGTTSLGGGYQSSYSTGGRTFDLALKETPYYLHFYAVGNEGGWNQISSGRQVAKNVISVGSGGHVNRDAQGNYISGGSISGFSSRGPADDGRIKPDIIANGESVLSTVETSGFTTKQGTSMATPNASGSSILLQDYFEERFPGHLMQSVSLKNLIVHTADDLGKTGPDYIYGWGFMNVRKAADLLKAYADNPGNLRMTEGLLRDSETHTYTFTWDGSNPLVANLAWLDEAGQAILTDDDRTSNLVHDLDLRVISPTGTTTYLPWAMPFVLNGFNTNDYNAGAVKADNTTDNIEQVRINTPTEAGVYSVTVSHKGTISDSVRYSLILSGVNNASSAPAPTITGFTPSDGDTQHLLVTVTGTGFQLGANVTLESPGYPTVEGYAEFVTPTQIEVRLPLDDAESGIYDLVVTNPDGQDVTAASDFTLTPRTVLLSENFDDGFSYAGSDWSTGADTGSNDWTLSSVYSISGNSAHVPTVSSEVDSYLESPAISIPNTSDPIKITFQHRWDFEIELPVNSFSAHEADDGAILQVSVNGGAFKDIGQDYNGGSGEAMNTIIVAGDYWDNLDGTNPIDDEPYTVYGWTDESGGFQRTTVELAAATYKNKTLRFRWRLGTQVNESYQNDDIEGWWIDNVEISVAASNTPPRFDSTPATSVAAGSSYSDTLSVTDVDGGDSHSFSVITKPSWLTVTDNGNGTASLSGTPVSGDVGTHAVEIEVSDGTHTRSLAWNVSVYPAGGNNAPSFLTTSLNTALLDTAYNQTVTATDADGHTLTLSVEGLPGWASLEDNGDGTATLSGTPGNLELGDITITVTASDGINGTEQEFTLTAAENQAPVITRVSPTKSVVGVPSGVGVIFDTTVTDDGVGGGSLTHTWSVVSSAGTVTWDQTDQPDTAATFSSDGTYELRLTADDGTNQTTLEIQVEVGASGSTFPTPPTPDLWYAFNEGTGSTVADSSNGSNTATLNGSISWVTGAEGTALDFDSSDDYVDSANGVSVSGGSFWSASAWVKQESTFTGNSRMILQQLDSGGPGRTWLSIDNSNRLTSFIGGSGVEGGTLTLNQWHHVAVTADGSDVTIYLDGVEVGSHAEILEVNAGGFRVGNFKTPAADRVFPGVIDDVAVYNRVLTISEINAMAAGTLHIGAAVSAGGPYSGTVGLPVSLDGTVSGGATPGWEHTNGSGAVSFGNTALEDTAATFDSDDTHTLRLVADDGTVKTFDDVTATINPSGPGTLALSSATYAVGEGDGTVTITVTRSGGNAGTVGLSYSTFDGSATDGNDYTSASGTLSWSGGDSADKTFQVSITDDTTVSEGDENFTVSLSSVTGGAGLGTDTGAVTISDNDVPPEAPTALTVTATSSTQMNLSWTDNSSTETGFILERSNTGGGAGFTQIATPSADTTLYTDTGLTASTQYFYRIRATNSFGNSAWSSEVDDTTDSNFNPSQISGLVGWYDAQALSGSDGSGVTTWADTTGGTNSTANNLTQNTNPTGTAVAPTLETVTLNGYNYRSVRFNTLTGDQYEQLKTTDLVTAGDTTRSIVVVYSGGVDDANSRPVGFGSTLDEGSLAGNRMTWNLGTDGNGTSRFDGAAISSGYGAGLNRTDLLIRTAVMESATSFDEYIDVLDVNFTDSQVLSNGTPSSSLGSVRGHFYVGDIQSTNKGGGAGDADFDVFEILVFDSVLSTSDRQNLQNWLQNKYTSDPNSASAPDAPANLSAVAFSSTSVNLSWSDQSENETGFLIHRSTVGGDSGFSTITTTSADATSFTDTGLSPATEYFYRVSATNSAGDSAASNEESATTYTEQQQFFVDNGMDVETTDPTADDDNDGMSNEEEYIAGTNPNPANGGLDDVFKLSPGTAPGGMGLQAPLVSGKYYRVSWRASLTGGPDWAALPGYEGTAPSDGSALDLEVTEGGFYRIEVSIEAFPSQGE